MPYFPSKIDELSGAILSEDFGEVTVTPSTETTLASITVPTGKRVRVKGFYAEGCVDGIYRIYIDTTKKLQARNAWTERNVHGNVELEASAGEVITLKVVHSNTASQPFSGMIYGYQI